MHSMVNLRSKEEAVALTTTLQNSAESIEARCAACDQLLALTKNDASCAVLCSAGGIHAVINAMKSALDCEPLLKGTLLTLHNLYRFDAKLTSIVVRLQEGIAAMLEGLREHIHSSDSELLLALLTVLSNVAHNTANVQVLVKENGTAVILASVLAHLKNDALLLPALSLLVGISRYPMHISTLVREGGVPAVLAAILAHLRQVEVVRASLIVLRNIVADDHSAMRLGGQGAYRIVFAVLQTHACVEQIELVRLGAAVLWRIHHARCPPIALLHSQLAFEISLDNNRLALCHDRTHGNSAHNHRSGACGLLTMARTAVATEQEDHEGNRDPEGFAEEDEAVAELAGSVVFSTALGVSVEDHSLDGNLTWRGRSAPVAAPVSSELDARPAVPQVQMRYGGHCDWLDSCPEDPEGLSDSSLPARHAELVVRSITAEAERLMAPAFSRLHTPSMASSGSSAAEAAVAGGTILDRENDLPDQKTEKARLAADEAYPRVVYDAFPSSGSSMHESARPGSLLFDSDFESANLRRAVQVGPYEYNLVLNCDVNTRGHTQWFLFRVRGMESGMHYRFHIINLMKADSLFSSGMRPLQYSVRQATESGVGWVRAGDEIAYFQNQYTYSTAPKKPGGPKKPPPGGVNCSATSSAASQSATLATSAARLDSPTASYYTLTFRMLFPHGSDDTVYVSQCYPYTYTMSQRLNARLIEEKSSSVVRREVLCHSYGGNVCDLLTVTDFTAPAAEVSARKVVVISARVHPGESNASWMMHGLLEAVTADSPEAQQLRRTLVLKIVPMLNPDGVILGNYRCSVIGVDLNRNWLEPHEHSHPTIFHLKRIMKDYLASEQLLLFCDLHGHSRKRNIFAYGCETLRGPNRLRERVFPRLLAGCAHFSLGACSFKVLRSKETTGRVVVWRQFQQPNSFTLEASFCGADFGPGAGSHYTTRQLKEMGAAFVPALLEFTDPSRVMAVMAELEAQFPAADNEDETEHDEGGTNSSGTGTGGNISGSYDASEKLRRAVRRSAAGVNNGITVASSAVKGAGVCRGSSISGGGKSCGGKKKEGKEEASKKKKKERVKDERSSSHVPEARAAVSTSPRNARN